MRIIFLIYYLISLSWRSNRNVHNTFFFGFHLRHRPTLHSWHNKYLQKRVNLPPTQLRNLHCFLECKAWHTSLKTQTCNTSPPAIVLNWAVFSIIIVIELFGRGKKKNQHFPTVFIEWIKTKKKNNHLFAYKIEINEFRTRARLHLRSISVNNS